MKIAIALLIVAGCSAEAAPATRTAWVAPLAWAPNELQGPVLRLLAERNLDPLVIGDRGTRFWVPVERHREASAVLKESPYAAQLKIHALLLGPGASAPQWGFGSEEASWSGISSFSLSGVPALQVCDVLKARGIECGVIAYAWEPEVGVVYVPSCQAESARDALRKSTLGDAIRITW